MDDERDKSTGKTVGESIPEKGEERYMTCNDDDVDGIKASWK